MTTPKSLMAFLRPSAPVAPADEVAATAPLPVGLPPIAIPGTGAFTAPEMPALPPIATLGSLAPPPGLEPPPGLVGAPAPVAGRAPGYYEVADGPPPVVQSVMLTHEPQGDYPYLARLDGEQKSLALALNGPVLGLAAAGSGKTTTFTHRIIHMAMCGLPLSNVLAVTFTKKAAAEMTARFNKLAKEFGIPEQALRGFSIGTQHAVATQIIKEYGSYLGLPKKFTIIDGDDQESILTKMLMVVFGARIKKDIPCKPYDLLSAISYSRNAMIPLRQALMIKMASQAQVHGALEAAAEKYHESRRAMQVYDFDDLLEKWLEILELSPAAREHMQQRWTYVMVDEYQDTNLLQDRILELLCRNSQNLFVVGDDRQSIYAFRAGNVENILGFENRWAQARTFHLSTNYRSGGAIIAAAEDLIAKNTRQLKHTVQTPNDPGNRPRVYLTGETSHEDYEIVKAIQDYHSQGIEYDKMMVLMRSNRQSIMLERELGKRGIPYYKKGPQFWQSAHMKLILSWMKVLHNPLDKMAFTRLLEPYPGIGDTSIGKIVERVNTVEDFESFVNGQLETPKGKSWPKVQEDLRRFIGTYLSAGEKKPLAAVQALGPIILEFITAMDKGGDRVMDISVVETLADKFEDMGALLEEIALLDEQVGDKKGRVLLSTIHGVKGLEADCVFIMGLNEKIFPSGWARTNEDMEEERRLMYVAMTRAARFLNMYTSAQRYKPGSREPEELTISRFLREIDASLLEWFGLESEGTAINL